MALTCGLAYEGLNNAGASDRDFIVILNDNEMSIAPNVGAMSKYLTSIQRNPLYNRVRSAIGSVMDAAPCQTRPAAAVYPSRPQATMHLEN
jgi:1-deoxy-D-xylulose-5-phosphate synthase